VSRFVTLPTNNPATTGLYTNTGGHVRRISVRETSGTANAVFELYDGSGVNGKLLDSVSLTPGQSTRDVYAGWEYFFETGLYLSVVSGTFKGTIVIENSDDWSQEGEPVLMVNPEVLALSVTAAQS
jgi:hypothetical protein